MKNTFLIIAAILFLLYMLSQRGTTSYKKDKEDKDKDNFKKMFKGRRGEKYCPMCK